ncbi:MAG: hypothetical protein D6796_09365 [Caldilineae bacterium]|nr:MAG: hypothetical protein D6796_09365 [Caldilineae bacterium]
MPPSPIVLRVHWPACLHCGACVAVCPQPAGFTSPFETIAVNTACELACLLCEKACPVSAISHRQAPAPHSPSTGSPPGRW